MKMILFFLLTLLSLFAFSQRDLISIYENNFSTDELLKVKEINNHYFIVSSTIKFDRRNNNKLNLISKAILFQYLKNQDIKIKGLELKQFQNALSWEKNHREYLFNFIKKENVNPLYELNISEENNIILEEIKLLEELKDKNETIHQQLKSLYFQKADIENYNREMDMIMKLKYEAL